MLKFEKTLPIGLQLYSVRDFLTKDFKGTLKKLKEIGYDYVEPAGLYNMPAAEFKAALDEAGLTAICAHVPYGAMLDNPEQVIADYTTLGVKFIAIPNLGPDERPGAKNFESFLSYVREFGKKCADAGMTLLFHNHDVEFVRMPDGRYGLDYMYETVDASLLQTELDCCWVKVAGEDPASYIRKYAGRCPVVHLKDYTGEKSENMYNLIGFKENAKTSSTFSYRPVGYGKQDIPSIITAAIESGALYLVVEQDNPGTDQTSLEAAEMSRTYLRTLGF